jgi:predicted SAM-dependent methyltransferase
MAAKKRGRAAPAKVPVDDPRPIRLDLGSGQTPKEGFTGVDKFHGDTRVDLCSGARWPWADSSVDELHCSHFIEHIPMVNVLASAEHPDGIDALVRFFNEAWRVAKPGASFALTWPALQNVRAFQDPTHRRFIPLQTMVYFSKDWRIANKLDHYLGATCDWVMVSGTPTILQEYGLKSDVVQAQNFREHWNWAQDFVAVLKAVK